MQNQNTDQERILEREISDLQWVIARWPTTGAATEVLEDTPEAEKMRTFFDRWSSEHYESSFRFLTAVLEHNSGSYEEWFVSKNPTHGRRWTLAERQYFLNSRLMKNLLIDATRRQVWHTQASVAVRRDRVRMINGFMRDMTNATTIENYR